MGYNLRVFAQLSHRQPRGGGLLDASLDPIEREMERELEEYPRPDFSIVAGSSLVALVETKIGAKFHGANQPATYLGLDGGTPLVVVVPKGRVSLVKQEVERLLELDNTAWSPGHPMCESCAQAAYRHVSVHVLSWMCALSVGPANEAAARLTALAEAVEGAVEETSLTHEFLSTSTGQSLREFYSVVCDFLKEAKARITEQLQGVQQVSGGTQTNLHYATVDFSLRGDTYFVGYLLYPWAEGNSASPLVIWNSSQGHLERSLNLEGYTNAHESTHAALAQLDEWISEQNSRRES